MRRILLLPVVCVLGLGAELGSQSSAAQEWPRLEPALVVAPGFRQTGWAEFLWRNGAWESARRRRLSYDQQGRLAGFADESFFLESWRASHRETLRYDAAGRTVETLVEESVGPSLRNQARYSYRYENNRLVEELLDAWSFQQQWTPIRRTAYGYDTTGRREREESQTIQGTVSRNAARILSRYDAAGRVSEELRQSDQKGAWIDTDSVRRRYDASARLVELLMVVVRPGQPPVETIKVSYTYDATGRRISGVTQVRGNAGTLQDSARQTYSYDRDGNQIETIFQGMIGGVWTDQRKETFSHESSR